MPLGPYADWDECLADNQDKADPEGYCGSLEQQATRGSPMSNHIALLVPEGQKTSDRRFFSPGSLEWRDDIPLMFQDKNEGHEGAVHVGNASNLRRETINGETWVVGDVTWDSDEDGREAQRLADEGKIAGVSVDLAPDMELNMEVLEVDDFGEPSDWLLTYDRAEIIGFTQLPMPAFAGAKILRSDSLDMPLVAAANPKATKEWFQNPGLAGPTPLTVTDEGRIYGHLATWGTCHTAFSGACVTPPKSASEYSFFNLGAVNVDGEEIHVGHITMGTGHAELSADASTATAHYDHTGTCVADVAAGEDAHGIWVAGSVRPSVDVEALRSASLSGDWRRINGELELVAALAVNVPGFPVPRVQARVAAGDQTTLVASGVVEQKSRDDLIVEALRVLGQKIDRLTADSVTVTESPVEEPLQDLPDYSALGRVLASDD